MSATPPRKTEGKQASTGIKLLAVAAVLLVIGLVIVLLVDGGTPEGIGVAFMSLASVPAVAGVVLLGAAVVSRRSRQGKPFA